MAARSAADRDPNPAGPMRWVRLAEVGGGSMKLRSATSCTRDQDVVDLPLKTFVILASFCQIYL